MKGFSDVNKLSDELWKIVLSENGVKIPEDWTEFFVQLGNNKIEIKKLETEFPTYELWKILEKITMMINSVDIPVQMFMKLYSLFLILSCLPELKIDNEYKKLIYDSVSTKVPGDKSLTLLCDDRIVQFTDDDTKKILENTKSTHKLGVVEYNTKLYEI
eukprot:UN23509